MEVLKNGKSSINDWTAGDFIMKNDDLNSTMGDLINTNGHLTMKHEDT